MASKRTLESVAVLGMGKVGELVGRLLHGSGFRVVAGDRAAPTGLPFELREVDATDPASVARGLDGVDAVVSALPYQLNGTVAEVAASAGVHYFDLTEDVPTTKKVLRLSEQHDTVFVPQCGLAPGLIGIVGSALAATMGDLRSLELRVGALPRHPSGLLGYAFNWSPEGVVNEYLNDCEVIRDGRVQLVPPMADLETVWIGGTQLEAFTTSGGLGTMCETYAGRIERLDYKTLRYPGHCALMRFVFDELRLRHRRDLAGELLVDAKPPVDDDIVYLYGAVEGTVDGRLQRRQYVRAYEPIEIDGRRWRAISWTTAASAAAVVELVASGELPSSGFVRQEDISWDSFRQTGNGSRFADDNARI